MSPSEKAAYELHQKALHREASLYESTYILGKGEGKIEGRIETATKMKQKGYAVEDISEMTGLSIDEIKKL